MGKKIKISEDQLKRLIVAKEGYATNLDKSYDDHLNETGEQDVNEFFNDPSYGIATNLAPTIIPIIMAEINKGMQVPFEGLTDGLKNLVIDRIFMQLKEEIVATLGLAKEDEEAPEEANDDDESYDDAITPSEEEDEMVNESVKKIQSTFKRFI